MSWRVTLDGTEVITPDGLQELRSTLQRDFESGGVFWSFTGDRAGVINLKFVGEGATILNNAWTVQGIDARVYITIERLTPGTSNYTSVYTGYSNMRSKSYDTEYFICSFEEVSLINQINSNLKTKVNLSTTSDIYGNAISAINYDTLTFDAVNLTSSASNIYTLFSYVTNTSSFQGPVFTEVSNDLLFMGNIGAFDQEPAPVISTGSFPTTGSLEYGGWIRAYPQSSSYSITVTLTANLVFNVSEIVGPLTGDITLSLEKRNVSTGVETTVDSQAFDASTGSVPSTDISFSDAQTITTDEYQYFVKLDVDNVSGDVSDDITLFSTGDGMVLSGISTYGASETTTNSIRLYHGITKNLEIITGQENLLYSDYLQSTLKDVLETNGYQLRNINRGLVGSLKDRMEMLKSVFGLGWGIEEGYTGDLDTVRVEEYEYFFENVEMLDLTNIQLDSYSEDYEEELDFSRVVIGYEKYGNDEEFSNIDSIEDFNTQASYKLPIENLEGTLSLTTKYVGSPILMELTRRKQFFLFDDKSWKYDDDLFLVDAEDSAGLVPRPDTNILNDVTFTYNILLNPRFNLFNNGKLINSVMYGKSATSVYFNEEYKVNSDGQIGYSTSFTNPILGDVRQYGSIGSVPVNNSSPLGAHVRSFDRIFDTTRIKFKVALTSAEVQTLISGHRNGLVSGNYGYITITNPLGDTVSGWLMNLEYNPVNEIGDFELIKKADDYFS